MRNEEKKKKEKERDKLEEGEEELGAVGKGGQLDKLFEALLDRGFGKVTRAVPDDPLLDDVRNTIYKCSIVRRFFDRGERVLRRKRRNR